ncbi:MAG TPA: hypothetical protein VK468_06715, partial [Pyrinomonadaceae bacterium]|nr:hypothetical protein [Pyrinomonadaceae bacterium]
MTHNCASFRSHSVLRYLYAALFTLALAAISGLPAQAQTFNQTVINSILGAFSPFAERTAPAVNSDDKKPVEGPASNLNYAVQYSQGFETDGIWAPTSTVIRVASGTNGVASKNGGFHGEVGTNNTQWGGYNSVFPTLGYVTSVDVYLNIAGGYANDTRFDFTSAINNSAGAHKRDFAFNAGFYNDA